MSAADIGTIVFYAPDVLIDKDGVPVALMPALVSELALSLEVGAVCPDEATASRVSEVYGEALAGSPAVASASDHAGVVRELLSAGVLNTTSTLFIDHHPRRCMEAVKVGIHAGIFEDAPRLYRDLGLWGLVPLMHQLAEVRQHLSA
jgi:hypothetical protein